MRIADIDPQSDIALSLLREAAVDIRPLYGAVGGPPWPQNQPLGPRDVYIAGFEPIERLLAEPSAKSMARHAKCIVCT